MSSSGRRVSRRIALPVLAAASTLLALLLLEGVVRAAFPDWAPRTARLTAFWQYDQRYGWTHVPGQTGRFASVGFDVAVRTNAKGFRGREIPYERQERVRRVVVLGDSHVWGFGVEEDETFGRRLEGLIPDLEVVNLGVSGYSTDQELLLYQDEGYRYGAEVVVLVVAHNDLWANTRTIESSVYGKPRFVAVGDDLVLDNHPVPPPSRVKHTLFDLSARSYLLTRALRLVDEARRAMTRSAGAPPPLAGAGVPAANSGEDRFPRGRADLMTVRLIQELQRSVARLQRSAQLLVVFADLRGGLGTEAAAYMGELGVRAVTLDTVIDPLDPAWHLPDGLHWTPGGHYRIAEALAHHLRPLLAATELPEPSSPEPGGQ